MKPVISSVFLTTIFSMQVLSEAGSVFIVVLQYPVSVPVGGGEGEANNLHASSHLYSNNKHDTQAKSSRIIKHTTNAHPVYQHVLHMTILSFIISSPVVSLLYKIKKRLQFKL